MVGLATEEDFKLDVFNTECCILAVGNLAPKGIVTTTYILFPRQPGQRYLHTAPYKQPDLLFDWGGFRQWWR